MCGCVCKSHFVNICVCMCKCVRLLQMMQMSISMCIYVYICMYACLHVCIYVSMYAMLVFKYANIHVYVWKVGYLWICVNCVRCKCAWMHAPKRVVCMCDMSMDVCMWVCTWALCEYVNCVKYVYNSEKNVSTLYSNQCLLLCSKRSNPHAQKWSKFVLKTVKICTERCSPSLTISKQPRIETWGFLLVTANGQFWDRFEHSKRHWFEYNVLTFSEFTFFLLVTTNGQWLVPQPLSPKLSSANVYLIWRSKLSWSNQGDRP